MSHLTITYGSMQDCFGYRTRGNSCPTVQEERNRFFTIVPEETDVCKSIQLERDKRFPQKISQNSPVFICKSSPVEINSSCWFRQAIQACSCEMQIFWCTGALPTIQTTSEVTKKKGLGPLSYRCVRAR